MTGRTVAPGAARISAPNVRAISGRPATLLYCFGIPPPAREPRPAATTRIANSDAAFMNSRLVPVARTMTLLHFTHGVNFLAFDAKISNLLFAALHKTTMIWE